MIVHFDAFPHIFFTNCSKKRMLVHRSSHKLSGTTRKATRNARRGLDFRAKGITFSRGKIVSEILQHLGALIELLRKWLQENKLPVQKTSTSHLVGPTTYGSPKFNCTLVQRERVIKK